MKLVVKTIGIIMVVSYPFAIYFGLNHFEPKYLALVLTAILVIKFFDNKSKPEVNKNQEIVLAVICAVIIVITLVFNSIQALKLYPVLINISMLSFFSYSLIYPPTVIERIARLSEPNLADEGVIYTRLITKIWCGFFVINASVALYTAYFTSFEIWTLYNGLIAYGLMAILLSGEWLYRKLILKK